MSHRATETQRKEFLCVSVALWLKVRRIFLDGLVRVLY